ncbi:unnamed protein product [Sordaria macrospora k-hell]|uniref:WGS project CABT00000000 data, contig 2.99 n=1 Tax=Sordaria macrospora (strain ATCC MYA-333 / DSM 997 / K(L3346) / K-hell) TaxID=771870 RepID=F7WC75_SORMK|nr:uncharacterized protein SMAC_09555 [Sordaria macrospora k-hell]CCC14557.1 unnamed protein product [Sordaria macrospora k-hell]
MINTLSPFVRRACLETLLHLQSSVAPELLMHKILSALTESTRRGRTRTMTGIRHWETMPRARLLRLARVSSSIAPSMAELTTVIPGPNDQKQNELLDIFHHTMTIALDGDLFKAPITEDPKNALDLGTGTGLWAIDFADKYPDCSVIGTDISLIQPTWVPPNLRFEVDDYNKEWTYKANFFDFVHIRWLTGTVKDWHTLYKEAYRCCKPGGWIEHIDASGTVLSDDGTVEKDMAMGQWGKIWQEAGRRLGTPLDVFDQNIQEEGLKEAGFVNISKKTYPVPLSPWPKDKKLRDVGLYFYAVLNQDLEGATQFIFGNVLVGLRRRFLPTVLTSRPRSRT